MSEEDKAQYIHIARGQGNQSMVEDMKCGTIKLDGIMVKKEG
jgi:hypothetical protein